MTLAIVDRAVQLFGAEGISQDTLLASMWTNSRTLRRVDAPDAIHLMQMGKNENKRSNAVKTKIKVEKNYTQPLFRNHGDSTGKRFSGNHKFEVMLQGKIELFGHASPYFPITFGLGEVI